MKMKDSGIPWIGQIPEDWEVAKYKFFANSGMGETILGGNLVEDGIPVYSATQNSTIFGYVKSSNLKLNKNDFVIPARGNSIGCVTIVKDNEATATQTTIYSKLNNNINYKFLYYCCVGLKNVWFYFEDTAIPQITVNQVQNNQVPLPPQEIQQKIVEILDKNCGQIDELVRIEENEIEKLKEYKTSLITKVVTKGLDPNAKMKDSGIPWIGQIPQDWEVGRLKNVCVERNEILSSTTDYDYEFRYIDISSVSFEQGILQYQNMLFKNSPSRARKIVRKNDVIISMVRTYLKAITLIKDDNNVIVSTGFAVLKTYNSNPQYIEFFVKSNYFSYMVTINSNGVSYPAINIENLLNIFLVIPDMQTQQQIVDYLDRRCEEIDNLIKIKQAKIEKLKEYKKSLIYQYVTGKKEIV